MPRFFYTVIDKTNKKTRGLEEAVSADELIARLQARNLIVVKIIPEVEEETGLKSEIVAQSGFKPRHYRITNEDLALFCRQLATLLGAGVIILKSLEVISKQVASRKLFNTIKELQKNMEQGLSLHEAMAKHPKIFSELWINLVETGEAGGNLSVVLNRLAGYLERNAGFRRKVISALIYPFILLLAGLIALLFLTIRIIPTFAELFSTFDITLPFLTRLLIATSSLIRRYSLVMIIIIIISFMMFNRYKRTSEGRLRYEKLKLKLPVFNDFFRALMVERFSSNMATLLESGVPILYTLEITEHSADSLIMADIIRKVKEDIRQGKPLNQPLQESGFFEPMVVQMVSIGEEIGELPQMFKKINAYYQEYVETFLTRLTTIFEPVMLLVMGVIIGLMVIGMFLPIFQITKITGK